MMRLARSSRQASPLAKHMDLLPCNPEPISIHDVRQISQAATVTGFLPREILVSEVSNLVQPKCLLE